MSRDDQFDHHAEWWGMACAIEGLVLDVDGVLTDGRLYYDTEGEAHRAFSVRDGLGIALARKAGLRIGIVSGRNSPTVAARADELDIDPCLLGRSDKASALDEVMGSWQLAPERIAAIGDDIIDFPLLTRVGLSMAPADADARLRERVHVRLASDGGRGAVREACELLLRATGKWEAIEQLYGLGEAGA